LFSNGYITGLSVTCFWCSFFVMQCNTYEYVVCALL